MTYDQAGHPPPPPGYGAPPPPGYGPPPPGYGPPPGQYYPPLPIGDTLSGAFEVYKNNFGAYFGFWAIPAIFAIVIGLVQILILGSSANAFIGVEEGGVPDIGAILVFLGIILMFTFVVMIVNILFTGGIIGMTKEAMLSGRTTMVMGFDTIKKYFGGILITSIVVTLLIVIGFMLCCIPGIFFCYWWMFAVTAVVVEGVGLSQAMDNSKQFATTRGTFWFAVVLIIVLLAINFIAGIITTAISFGLMVTLGFWPGQIVSGFIGQIFQWVIAPYATIAIAFHYIRGKGYDRGGIHPPPGPQYPPPGYGGYPPPPQSSGYSIDQIK